MSDNPVIALLGAAIVIAISIITLGASGDDALDICYDAVTRKCSHATYPAPCTNEGINRCDKTHMPKQSPKPSEKRPRPNREIVLQGGQ